jgi:hypothetical protein
VSIVAYIDVRIMVRRQRVQSVTVITTPPAGVHIGTRAFAAVGTNEHAALTPTPRFAVSRSSNIEEALANYVDIAGASCVRHRIRTPALNAKNCAVHHIFYGPTRSTNQTIPSASRDDGLPPANRREHVIPALTDH